MERWAKSVNAAKAVQQQQLQAVIKAEVQVAASAPAVVNSPSLTIADLSTKSGIALTAALKEVSSEIVDHINSLYLKWYYYYSKGAVENIPFFATCLHNIHCAYLSSFLLECYLSHAGLHRVMKTGLPLLPMPLMLQSLLVATSLSLVAWI